MNEKKLTLLDHVKDKLGERKFFKIENNDLLERIDTIKGILGEVRVEKFSSSKLIYKQGNTRPPHVTGGAQHLFYFSNAILRGLTLTDSQTLDYREFPDYEHSTFPGIAINGTYQRETYRVEISYWK